MYIVSVVLVHPVLAAVHVPLAVHNCVQPVELGVPSILKVLWENKYIYIKTPIEKFGNVNTYLREATIVSEILTLRGEMRGLAHLLCRGLIYDILVLLN